MSTLLGFSGICYALYFVFTYPRDGFAGYFDYPSLVLLGIAPICIMLMSHSIKDLFTGIITLISSIFVRDNQRRGEVINFLSLASQMVRKDGIGSLLTVKDKIRSDFLRDGIAMIVNNFSVDEIRHNLMAKIDAKQTRLELAANMFENLAKVSPGVGMVGTLLGLIEMMSDLSDPSNIGSGMALAMITTLYGLLLGTFIYGPCSEKINLEREKQNEMDLLVLEGVVGLKDKKSSLHFKDIMKTYGHSKKAAS
jgi:chemotaxis protein MotA